MHFVLERKHLLILQVFLGVNTFLMTMHECSIVTLDSRKNKRFKRRRQITNFEIRAHG